LQVNITIDRSKFNPERFIDAILKAVQTNVLKQLAELTITNITSGIDRQRDIDGGVLKQNAPSTTARKLRNPATSRVKIGKSALASFGGSRQARSLVDEGMLRLPSTYNVKKISDNEYQVNIRAERDKIAQYVMEKGYNFYGIPIRIRQDIDKILANEVRKVLK
jgi:hypothetical protein